MKNLELNRMEFLNGGEYDQDECVGEVLGTGGGAALTGLILGGPVGALAGWLGGSLGALATCAYNQYPW